VSRASVILCGVLLIFSVIVGFAYDREAFLFLDEIEIGMRGIAKTIVSSNTISEFAVEVLGVIDEPKTHSDFIVVRVSGEAIGRSGGISQGMSGSPVYIDGKLIGALSRAATWSKEITPIGLVTPIEEMLGIIESITGDVLSLGPREEALLAEVQLVKLDRPPHTDLLKGSPDTIFAYPVSSPLLVTGLSGRALKILMEGADSMAAPEGLLAEFLPLGIHPVVCGLSSFGLTLNPVSGGESGSFIDGDALEPGSAIGVALASGDVTIGALGTLTYREGDAIIGFGHPFLLNGEAAFPLTSAYIYDTMKAYDASFKLGTLGESLGAILEDRLPGIGGLIDRSVDLITLSLDVSERDAGRSEDFQIELVDEPRIMPVLLLASGFEAIDATLDRIGQGTVEVTYQIFGDGMPTPLKRRDVFLSTKDVAIYPPWQLASIVSFLQYNDFQDPKISNITASMQFTQKLSAMHINHLELDQIIYEPGDIIHYQVELQTYHGEKRIEEGEIEIPIGLIADYIVVRAYGGPRYLEAGETPIEFEDLSELIEAVEDLPSYDTLTVELFAPDPLSPYIEALQGVEEVETELTGYFLYDEREVNALLFLPE